MIKLLDYIIETTPRIWDNAVLETNSIGRVRNHTVSIYRLVICRLAERHMCLSYLRSAFK